jgi:hypothetical protein
VPFSQKPATSITKADLVTLIESREPEGKEIDYKRALPGKSDSDRREFLYDLSSFANTLGGYLVFGIEETDGLPTAIRGLGGVNPDAEIRRLEEMARDGIRPPVLGLQSVAVPLGSAGIAIVMHIPKSWNPPHQVIYQKAFRFYARDSNGKYQLDVEELRNVFVRSQDIAERMRQFRFQRIAKIAADDVVAVLSPGARMVIHLLPISAFGTLTNINLRTLGRDPRPLVGLIGGLNSRFNADGFVGWSDSGYAQVFRNGCLETVSICANRTPLQGDKGFLPSVGFEQQIFRKVKNAKELLQSLLVECPIAVMVSFTGIKGWRMGLPPGYSTTAVDVFDRDPLLVPEILIETFDGSPVTEVRPIVDSVWNASGWPGSPHYDDDGVWDCNRVV